MNPSLVARKRNCKVCREVKAIEDLNARVVDDNGQRRVGFVNACNRYLADIGHAQYNAPLLTRHAAHVLADLARKPEIHPDKAVRVSPEGAPAAWFDVHDAALEVGMDALRDLNARLLLGALEEKHIVALAKIGVTAASKRADIESRGRQTGQVIAALGLIASGHAKQVAARVGSVTVTAELGEGAAGVAVDGEV